MPINTNIENNQLKLYDFKELAKEYIKNFDETKPLKFINLDNQWFTLVYHNQQIYTFPIMEKSELDNSLKLLNNAKINYKKMVIEIVTSSWKNWTFPANYIFLMRQEKIKNELIELLKHL